jgi:hypothetical protein
MLFQDQKTNTLYLFIDESGDFNFSSPKGSKYFILTCVSTIEPLEKRNDFLRLKYRLLQKGYDQEYFHATNDKQYVRDEVFNLINKLEDFEIDSVIAQKNKVNLTLYIEIKSQKKESGLKFTKKKVEERFYRQVSETLLQYVIRRYVNYRKHLNINKIVVICGSLFYKNKQEFIKKYIKSYFKDNFRKVPYTFFHQVKADINCQIADYCSWAISVKWERGGRELRPYDSIKKRIKSEFEIFEKGEVEYYKYN